MSGMALVALAENDVTTAQLIIQAALQELNDNDHPFWRRQVHYAAYCVWLALADEETAVAHLCQAARAVTEITDKLPAAERAVCLKRVPLNRKIQAALGAHALTSQVKLVKAAVPLGQKLNAAAYTNVTWTLFLPTDDLIANRAQRRRHILQRLLQEAAAQGAAATDEDLATAVAASRRTIMRDLQQLAAAGVPIPTRRRS
jgi:hypothetical protein